MSRNSGIFDTVSENGRTWLESSQSHKYMQPTDDQEQDRLDMQHLILNTLFGDKLALAPIEKIPLDNVLDLATGTGIWATQFAKEHPSTSVVGTDLTSSQFFEQGKPENCTLLIEDIEEPWNHTHPWDYIHGRALIGILADPAALMQKAFGNLVPGGYLELQEIVFPFCFAKPPPKDSPYRRWNELTWEANKILPRKYDNAKNYAKLMREAGFVDVQEQTFFLPCGEWTGEPRHAKLGSWQMLNFMNGIEGATMRNLRLLGMPVEEIDELVEGIRQEIFSGEVHSYWDIVVVYGRKPL